MLVIDSLLEGENQNIMPLIWCRYNTILKLLSLQITILQTERVIWWMMMDLIS